MYLIGTERIDPVKGEYLAIVDNGYEGLAVACQQHSVENVLMTMARHACQSFTVVKLVNIEAKEIEL